MSRSTSRRLGIIAGLVVLAVACQLVAHATRHHSGAAGVLSWITFAGFWVSAAAAALGLVLTTAAVFGRRTVRS